MPILSCSVCAEDFKADRFSRKYCSRDCKHKGQIGQELAHRGVLRPDLARAAVRACEVCGTSFRAVKDYEGRKQRFCGKECWTKRVVLEGRNCRACGIAVGRSKTYCSKACAVQHMVGPNSAAYIDGKAAERNHYRKESPQLAKWRVAVFKRDNYTCQQCAGKGGDLHAHHLKPYATHAELRLVLDNGLTLCVECHSRVHGRNLGKMKK